MKSNTEARDHWCQLLSFDSGLVRLPLPCQFVAVLLRDAPHLMQTEARDPQKHLFYDHCFGVAVSDLLQALLDNPGFWPPVKVCSNIGFMPSGSNHGL